MTVRDGLHPREWVARVPVRWSTGDAVFDVAGERPITLILGRFQPPAVGVLPVDAVVGGRVVAHTAVAPRRSRFDPWLVRLTVPPIGAGRHELRLSSPRWSPAGLALGSEDGRELGVAVVAVEAGGVVSRLAGLAGQLTSLPATDQRFLDTYQLIAANSAFTQSWIMRLWGRESDILYPPVTPQPRVAKAPIILGVGRFFDPADGHNKRQLELVAAFARLRAEGRGVTASRSDCAPGAPAADDPTDIAGD